MEYNTSLVKVESMPYAMRMREIRNNVRQFMTHNQEVISIRQQWQWFTEDYEPALKARTMFAFLHCNAEAQPIGYGIVRQEDGRWWVTGALEEKHRGQGNGFELFSMLTEFVNTELGAVAWLDVLKTNEAAIGLYKKLGYEVAEETPELLIMFHEEQNVRA